MCGSVSKLQNNRLTYVPLWFPAATELREVYGSRVWGSLPLRCSQRSMYCRWVRSILASNDIRAIADAAFGSSTKLERVDLDYNANLKRLPAGFLPGQPTLYAGVCVPGRWCLVS